MLRHGLWPCLIVVLGCQSKHGQDLSVAQLTAVVGANQESLRPCYQAALDKQPDSTEFRIQATLHVKKDGNVESVELESRGLANVGSCVEKTVRTWKFPPAQADTYASMPLIFRPTVEPMFEAPRNPFENEGTPQAQQQPQPQSEHPPQP